MTPVTSNAAAWTALLPGGAVVAIAAPPWALRGRSETGDPAGTRTYIAVPSRERPLLVASRDPEVLRYLADSVLSVPPGAGPAVSLVLTVGLRLLRYRGSWILAAALRAAGVVRVGRPG